MASKNYSLNTQQPSPSGGGSVDLQPLWTKINEMNETLQTCYNDYSESNSSVNDARLIRVNGNASDFDFIEQIKTYLNL